MDDLLIIGPDQSIIEEIINKATMHLKLQYLGLIKTFLGITYHINQSNKTIYLEQSKYARNILSKYNILDNNIKPTKLPYTQGIKLTKLNIIATTQAIYSY